MHFQYAAWPFQYIRDNMEVSAFATSDFDKDLLTFHVNVLLVFLCFPPLLHIINLGTGSGMLTGKEPIRFEKEPSNSC